MKKRGLVAFIQQNILHILAVILWAAFAITFFSYQWWSGRTLLELATDIFTFIHSSWYGIAVLLLIYCLRPLLFFPVTILRLIIGSLFGFWAGLPIVLVAEMLSASVAYLLGKTLGDGLIPLDGQSFLSTWKKRLREHSFTSVFFLELTFLHFDVVHYFCGMMRLHFLPFLMGSTLGLLPGLLGFVSFGASIENLQTLDPSQITFKPEMILLGAACIATGVVISIIYHKKQGRKSAPVKHR